MLRLQDRPTGHEIYQRLKEAKEALVIGRAGFASFDKCFDELSALDIQDTKEIWPLIGILLTEVQVDDYAGARPPHKSYEVEIEKYELYAFEWESKTLGKTMYIKFAIKEGCFYYVSLHESRSERK